MSCFRSIALRRILRRMDEHVAVGGDREVALAPAIDLVQFGRVVDGEELPSLPGLVPARRGSAHAIMIHTFFYDGRAIGQKRGGERARTDHSVADDADGRSSRTCAREPGSRNRNAGGHQLFAGPRPSEPASTETTS